MLTAVVATDDAYQDYRALVEQVEDYAMFVLDLDGRITTWNRGAEHILQYAPQQIIGQHLSKLYPEADVAAGKPARELELTLAHGHVEEESWRLRADGTCFWAFASITLLRDNTGRPRGFAKVTRDLTEMRHAQEALRRSEERFRLLVEAVSDYAIYMLDPRGTVATWNVGAEKIKQYRADQIVGRSFSVFFTPEDQAAGKPMAELRQAEAEGRFAEEGWRVRADGSRFWASVLVTALRDTSGTLVGFSKITRDLTAQKAAEETARELSAQHLARAVAEASESRAREDRERFRILSEQLEVILEGVVDGITVQDRSGKITFANSAAARLSGLRSREEFQNVDGSELMKRFEVLDEHGYLFPPANLPGRRVLAGERQASALMHVRDKLTGASWWSQVRANAVLGDNGIPELAVNIWHDISHERRQDEHERYLSEATATLSKSLDYQTTLDALARLLVPGLADWCTIYLLDGSTLRNVAVAHADPRKKKQAEAYQAKYPPNPDEPLGVWQVIRTGSPILHENVPHEAVVRNATSAEHLQLLEKAELRSLIFVPIKAREKVLGAISLVTAESGRRYDARDLSVATELGRRVGTFIENALLFERAQAAAQRAEAAAREAEAAGRMKDEFLATVSHELRTPLNAIMGWASLLKNRGDLGAAAKGVEVIHRNAAAQSKIIEDILDVSRIITGKLRLELRTVDLVSIVSDALEAVRNSAAARDITLEFQRPSAPITLVGDAERLQQVMWNLLSNAVKFNEHGGRVTVAVEALGSELAVSVTDNGKGIDPDFVPYVFDRFKQADSSTTRRFGGLGLGLAIVRHIVELHGGRASVSSSGVGQGATFRVVLPIHAVAPVSAHQEGGGAPTPSSEHAVPSTRLDGLRILVVDDEADARDLLDLVLTEAGAKVRTANTAGAAFASLSEFLPHVIVSDIGMPDEDGYSFMRRVRQSAVGADTPAIALTAYTRAEDRHKAMAMGFSAHIGKPVNPRDLVELVAGLTRAGAAG